MTWISRFVQHYQLKNRTHVRYNKLIAAEGHEAPGYRLTFPLLVSRQVSYEMGGERMIFDVGDTAYIVENCHSVRQVQIAGREGDMYLVKTAPDSGFMIRHTRLYATQEEAKKQIIPLKEVSEQKHHSPYDYWH